MTTNKSSSMRQAIAKLTSHSFANVPHFYLRAHVDATALVELRNKLANQIKKACGTRLTVTDMLLRAMALALRDCPWANCIWQDNTVVKLPEIGVGLAVGLHPGLMIVVIHQADRLDLTELTGQRAELVAAAKAGKLPARTARGGASSLSNLGTARVDEFTAIIYPPQSTMLAVGRLAPRGFVVDDKLSVRTTLQLCLSVDHRVLDGSPGADFLERIVEYLEQPSLLL